MPTSGGEGLSRGSVVGRLLPASIALLIGVAACRSARPTAALPEWSFVVDLRIGADDPEGLSQVKGLLVTQRGQVWVLEASTHDIRMFDSAGRSLGRIGRRGQGPGEFEWPDGMAAGPDGTVWVHDPQNGRFTLFSEAGRFIRQQSAPAGGHAWTWTGGIDRTGRVWDEVFERREAGAPVRLRRARPDWSREDTLELPRCPPPSWRSTDAYYQELIPGTGAARYSVAVPFYPHPVLAFDWAAGAVWCAPSGAEYQFVKLDIERRDTLARISGSTPSVPVRPEERDSAIRALRTWLADLGEPDVDWGRIPAAKPVVAAALVDEAGRLWVRRSTTDSVSLFDLYSATGTPVATVRIPYSISWWVPPVVRGNRVWLIAVDSDGVPFVIRGRLGP